ncbi:MAG: DUF3180 domain-containing protein, partial [Actinomycetes bacterium]
AVLPPLPWAAPLGIAALGLIVAVSALALRRRLRGSPGTKPPHPLGVARMAVLGKAASHVGPILAGIYAGYALLLLPDMDISGRRDRAIIAGAAALAGMLLTGAGLLLERTCRVGPSRDDEGPPPVASGP